MKIAIILGTRPEIIKMSSIIRECKKRKLNYFILHSGQHYSFEMDLIFFKELELPQPKYNVKVVASRHGAMTGKMLIEIEKVLEKEKPDIVLVEGDTNTVLAGALAASKLHIKVGHIEAGLRSYDREMPEETNRVLVDHISDYLFCPTYESKKIALGEGINNKKIFVTGNTIVDAVYQNLDIANKKVDILKKLNLKSKQYFLITAHRPSNVDKQKSLSKLLLGFEKIYREFKLPLIYPIHPRTQKMIKKFKLRIPQGLRLISPQGFFEFLKLEANARLILTDSGGVQEEACTLQVPCVTLRANTERPETLKVKSNILVQNIPNKMLAGVKLMLNKKNNWKNPFGDGKASKKILNILTK